MKNNKHSSEWSDVSEKLQGFGPVERAVDMHSSSWRARLPDIYFDESRGFRDILMKPMTLTYRDENFLIAIPTSLIPEYLAGLRYELCEAGKLSGETFRKLHESLIYTVSLDCRNRWPINAHLQLHLHFNGDTNCIVVFQTRGATIEIRTLGRYRRELAQAQTEVQRLNDAQNPPASAEKPGK